MSSWTCRKRCIRGGVGNDVFMALWETMYSWRCMKRCIQPWSRASVFRCRPGVHRSVVGVIVLVYTGCGCVQRLLVYTGC